jgi:dipeptidyl aminopeptidase/acylaminoacyl peptidase
MRWSPIITATLVSFVQAALAGPEDFPTRTLNNGNLILEGIPEIPLSIKEDLKRFQNIRSAVALDWTRDGEGLFILTRFGNVNQIHRVDQAMGMRRQLTFRNDPVRSVVRRPGSDELTFTIDRGGSEFNQIYLLDPDTGDARLLTDGESRNESIKWSRSGDQFAYRSTRRNGRSNDLWIMDPDDPASARIALKSENGSSWSPVDWSRDGKRLLVREYRSIQDSHIYTLDLNDGTLIRWAGEDGPSATSNYPIGFDADDSGFFFITNANSNYHQLAYRSWKEPESRALVAVSPWDIETAALSDNRKHLAFTVNEGGRSALYLYSPDKRKFRKVDGVPQGLVGGLIFSPDSSQLALTANTAKSPSDAFVVRLQKGMFTSDQVIRWTQSEIGGLNPDRFIEPELIQYTSFDGRSIPTFIYKPDAPGPWPVVILIHGGPESQFRPGFSGMIQMWIDKLGVAVIAPNVRGSRGYGSEYVSLDNGRKREDSVKDIGALLDWIATQSNLDASRVAAYGGSYGGYMVLACATHFSDRLKAAVDVVGISNFVTFLENTQAYRRDLRRAEYGDERDPEMRAFLQRISPIHHVDKVTIPLLVVQGQNDPRVPVTESEQIVRALRASGKTVWYMNALDEGHGYLKKENRDVFRQATLLFLREHLLEASN